MLACTILSQDIHISDPSRNHAEVLGLSNLLWSLDMLPLSCPTRSQGPSVPFSLPLSLVFPLFLFLFLSSFFPFFSFFLVCICVSVCLCMWELEVNLSFFSRVILLDFFHSSASKSRHLLISASPAPRWPSPAFLCRFQGLNSGHAFKARALSSKPSP